MSEEASLEAVVSAVPGVTRLYPAGDLLGRASAAIGSALSGDSGGGTARLVAVGPERISIRIGVHPLQSAAEVCRAAYTAARAWAVANGMPDSRIDVTVATIEGE